MIRPLVTAALAGAIWGTTIALTADDLAAEQLLLVGRFGAVAFLCGLLTPDPRVGVPAGAILALAHFAAMELTPWRGIEHDAAQVIPEEDAAFIADVFRQGTRLDWLVVAVAAVLGGAGALARRGARAGWAVLAGALVADLLVIDRGADLTTALAVLQAAAGVHVARRFVGRDLALVAALVPLALVLAAPSMLGEDVIAQDEGAVIR